MNFSFAELFNDYTLRVVALGAASLGLVSGALGSFAVLRKQSLLGDAISHAALPGIAIAFLLTGSRQTLVLTIGAAIAGWIATLLVMSIVRTTRIKSDGALGLVLSVFFGCGLMLLTYIQKLPSASQAGLDKFLFGQAATLLERDVILIAALGSFALVVMLLCWKEFKLLSFDPDFAASLGINVRFADVLLTFVLVLAIITGLQTVGVVLMSAIIIAPAAAARQWTNRLGVMVTLAALFGAVAGASGAVLSSTVEHLPTGPMIVLCLSFVVIVSLLFAPARGLLWRAIASRRNRARLNADKLLEDLYSLASQHAELAHPHGTKVLAAMNPSSSAAHVRAGLQRLNVDGLVNEGRKDEWSLTDDGVSRARYNLMSGANSEPNDVT